VVTPTPTERIISTDATVTQQTSLSCCRIYMCDMYAVNAYVSQLIFIFGYLVTVSYGKLAYGRAFLEWHQGVMARQNLYDKGGRIEAVVFVLF
jgi:hypothetical protein